jgi:hypothetical protein
MEGFSFLTSVTGLNRPNTGKEDDDDEKIYRFIFVCVLIIFTDIGVRVQKSFEPVVHRKPFRYQ